LYFKTMGKHILLIEDEAAIADTIVYALEREAYRVTWHTLGGDGLSTFKREEVDLVVLDVGLPDISGFDVCRELRRASNVPVLFLTARADEIDRVVGFELGADDYVPKPFSPRELVARVRAILRRGVAPSSPIGLRHDEKRAAIFLGELALDLTRYEYRLLATLMAEPDRVFSRTQLMDRAWDEPDASFDRTVDAHIKSLRAKLKAADPHCNPIRTHRGLGYSLSWQRN
jgi:two-component system catabolic regulation response regulator CreB